MADDPHRQHSRSQIHQPLLTGVPLLGLAEWLVHMLIDWGKCRNLYRLPVDQSLHLFSKAIWALLALVVFAV